LARTIRTLPDAHALPLIALSSLGRREAEANANDLHQGKAPSCRTSSAALAEVFASFLTKPIKQSQLYSALVAALTRQRSTGYERPMTSAFDAGLAQRVPLRILLAEDVTVNQKLMVAMLGRMGYRADIAADGLEVLAALERQPYDLVLMDVQMPEMDGMEASRQIRTRWPAEQQPYIIALTANALKEDRAACLAAGMNDYLSKPVQAADLQEALVRCGARHWAPRQAPANHVAAPADAEESVDPLQLAGLCRLGNQEGPDVLQELLGVFQADAPRLIAAIRDGVTAGDAERVRAAAHSLRGAAANLGARQLAALCFELESKGCTRSLQNAPELVDQLEPRFASVCVALRAAVEARAVPDRSC
jgi:CheY-like chemotaxis protein